jgi:rare lipoprotein A
MPRRRDRTWLAAGLSRAERRAGTLLAAGLLTAAILSGCGGSPRYRPAAAPAAPVPTPADARGTPPAPADTPALAPAPADPVAVTRGTASYYHDKFHGRRTANGEIYDRSRLTAAHRSLPFGTRLRVTNRENGKSVTVVVNDRGPFVKGRVIDLSRAAASKLDFLKVGLAEVEFVILD